MNEKPLLTDGVVTLRALDPADIDTLLGWENDSRLWTVSGTQAPFSRHVLWRYLEAYTTDIFSTGELRLMVTDAVTGEALGTADLMNLHPLHRHAEAGVMIAAEHCGKGFATRAVALLNEYAFEHLGLHQLYAVADVKNAPCLAAFTRNGYKPSGTLRQWIRSGKDYNDAVVLQCTVSMQNA